MALQKGLQVQQQQFNDNRYLRRSTNATTGVSIVLSQNYIPKADSSGFLVDSTLVDTGTVFSANTTGLYVDYGNGNVTINGTTLSDDYDLLLAGDGVLALKEGTTPTADSGYGKLYTRDTNLLYFQDGGGTNNIVAFGGGAINKIAWWSANDTLSDSTLHFDNSNNWFGMGTTAMQNVLHIQRNNTSAATTLNGSLLIVEQRGTGDAGIQLELQSAAEYSILADNSDADKFAIYDVKNSRRILDYNPSTKDTQVGTSSSYVELGAEGLVKYVGTNAGVTYGEIYGLSTATTITISVIGTDYQITAFASNGESNNMTPDHTNNHITVLTAGRYMCTCSITAESVAGAGALFSFDVAKNNNAAQFANLHAHRQLAGGGGDVGSVSISGIIDLAVNDTIEVWVSNETNTQNIVIDDATLSLVMLGGT